MALVRTKSFNEMLMKSEEEDSAFIQEMESFRPCSPLSQAIMSLHYNCRNNSYPGGPQRANVPDELVRWDIDFSRYNLLATYYTAPDLPDWADKPINIRNFWFNTYDDGISRYSYTGNYMLSVGGFPLNPVGRTGIYGQGLLPRFGPNLSLDPLVTRWKKDEKGLRIKDAEGLDVLELVVIKKHETGDWSIPRVVVNDIDTGILPIRIAMVHGRVNMIGVELSMFEEPLMNGEPIYQGYIDDPRNTDNAWVERQCLNFHDDDGSVFDKYTLQSDEKKDRVEWISLTADLKIDDSDIDIVRAVYKLRVGCDLHIEKEPQPKRRHI